MKPFYCPYCSQKIGKAIHLETNEVRCPSCRKSFAMEVFPALLSEPPKGKSAELRIDDRYACCFYHEDHTAASSCVNCGVYICSLCDFDFDGQHWCPKCLEKQRADLVQTYHRSVLYDTLILLCAIFGCLLCPLGPLTAMLVLLGVMVFWNKVEVPYPRSKWRMILALALAGCYLVVTFAAIVIMVWGE